MSAVLDIDRLKQPESFRDIWFRTAWLNDMLELRRDHHTLRQLLRSCGDTADAATLVPALQLAMDLFKLHAAVEYQLPQLRRLRPSVEHVLMLIEQVEDSDPEDPLYLTRVGALRTHLEVLISVEEDLYDELRGSSSLQLSGVLLEARSRVLRAAGDLFDGTDVPEHAARPH